MKKKHLVDLHIHSNFSDGKLSVSEIVDIYGAKGFSAIAITDHLADSNTLTGYVTQKLKLSLTEANFDDYLQVIEKEAKRAWEKYSMLLIPGVEVTLNSWSRQQGAHIVYLGIDRFIDPNHSIKDVLKQNLEFFSIAAHPLWEKPFEFKTTYLWDHREELKSYFNAWECGTSNHFAKEVFTSGLPVIASSDFHGAKFESWKTVAYLEELSTPALYQAIESRQVEPIWM